MHRTAWLVTYWLPGGYLYYHVPNWFIYSLWKNKAANCKTYQKMIKTTAIDEFKIGQKV